MPCATKTTDNQNFSISLNKQLVRLHSASRILSNYSSQHLWLKLEIRSYEHIDQKVGGKYVLKLNIMNMIYICSSFIPGMMKIQIRKSVLLDLDSWPLNNSSATIQCLCLRYLTYLSRWQSSNYSSKVFSVGFCWLFLSLIVSASLMNNHKQSCCGFF